MRWVHCQGTTFRQESYREISCRSASLINYALESTKTFGEHECKHKTNKSSSSAKQPFLSLEDSARLHLVFTSLYFVKVFFYRIRSLTLRPTLNLDDQAPVFMSRSDRVAQLYPQASGSLGKEAEGASEPV
jgi:hypothetical protein